ncbi:MAG: hypothetical protein MJ098_06650 [Saccharofermentans sp.]|nr:hypothetical protein [Saccharofermentans sp.]
MKKSRSTLKRFLSLALVMTTIVALFSVPVSAETYKKVNSKKILFSTYTVYKSTSQYFAHSKKFSNTVYFNGATKTGVSCTKGVSYSSTNAFSFSKSVGLSVPVEYVDVTASVTNGGTQTLGISKSVASQYSWTLEKGDKKGYYYISAVVPFHKCKVDKTNSKGDLVATKYSASIDKNRSTFVALLYSKNGDNNAYKIYD